MHATWLPLSIISALCYTALRQEPVEEQPFWGHHVDPRFSLDAMGWFEDHVFFGKSALDFRGVVWLHLAGL